MLLYLNVQKTVQVSIFALVPFPSSKNNSPLLLFTLQSAQCIKIAFFALLVLDVPSNYTYVQGGTHPADKKFSKRLSIETLYEEVHLHSKLDFSQFSGLLSPLD